MMIEVCRFHKPKAFLDAEAKPIALSSPPHATRTVNEGIVREYPVSGIGAMHADLAPDCHGQSYQILIVQIDFNRTGSGSAYHLVSWFQSIGDGGANRTRSSDHNDFHSWKIYSARR
jgi:hypothetical protein